MICSSTNYDFSAEVSANVEHIITVAVDILGKKPFNSFQRSFEYLFLNISRICVLVDTKFRVPNEDTIGERIQPFATANWKMVDETTFLLHCMDILEVWRKTRHTVFHWFSCCWRDFFSLWAAGLSNNSKHRKKKHCYFFGCVHPFVKPNFVRFVLASFFYMSVWWAYEWYRMHIHYQTYTHIPSPRLSRKWLWKHWRVPSHLRKEVSAFQLANF